MLVLSPILLLLAALVAWPALSARLTAGQPRRVLILVTGAAFVLALALRFLPGPHSLTLLTWQPPEVFGGSLILAADRVSAVAAIGLTALAFTAALARPDLSALEQPRLSVSALGLTLAALIFIFAGNLFTLAATWLLVDLAVWMALVWSTPPPPLALRVLTVGVNYAGSLLVFLTAVMSFESGPAVASLPWTSGMVRGLAPALLTLAAFVRLAAYPLHRTLPEAGDKAFQGWLRMTPVAAGVYLLVRATSLAGGAPIEGLLWTLLAGGSALAAALLAAIAASRDEALRSLAAYAAAMLALGLTVGPVEAPPLALYGAISLLLALGALYLGESLPPAANGQRAWWWGQAMRWIALLSLWGAPPTLGFYHRWGVMRANLGLGDIPALALGVLAATLASAALWSLSWPIATSAPQRRVLWPTLAGLSLLSLPLLAFGLQPTLIQPALVATAGALAPAYIADLVRGTVPSAGIVVGLLIVLPWLAGWLLWRQLARQPGDTRALRALRYSIGLDWIFNRRWRPVGFVYRSLQTMLSLGENERYVGLLFVLTIVTAIALLAQL